MFKRLTRLFMLPALCLSALSPTTAAAIMVEKKCFPIRYTEEYRNTGGYATRYRYFLRYNQISRTERVYSVFDSATKCSFVIAERIDPERDDVHLINMRYMTALPEDVHPAPVQIGRFLSDRALESRIVTQLFEGCRKSNTREQCRKRISEETGFNSAVLDVRYRGSKTTINIFDDTAFLSSPR